jgi:hypothetical protein
MMSIDFFNDVLFTPGEIDILPDPCDIGEFQNIPGQFRIIERIRKQSCWVIKEDTRRIGVFHFTVN